MYTYPRAGRGRAFRIKVGLALIGAVLVVGGGTAMAMASHAQLPFTTGLSHSGTPTAHSDSDENERACTGSTTATPSAHSDSDEASDHESGTPSAHASPTAHATEASDHESGTPSATKSATSGDDEANEHESSQEDQDECGKSTATRTPAPERTEQPEGTPTGRPTPTKGPGGD